MGSRLFASLLAAVLLAGVSGCRRDPPEQALRATIAAMQSAAERGDTDALFDPIAEDFAASEGMDKTQFRRYVTLLSLRNARVGVQLGPVDVKLFGERATASFTAALTGGANWLPERARVYQVDTGWRMEGDKWTLISAKWRDGL